MQVGTDGTDPATGFTTRSPIKGSDGVAKLLSSPLVKALKVRYLIGINPKIAVLRHLNNVHFDRFELSIQAAVGLTILVNPMLKPSWFSDASIQEAFDNFKIFWVNYALKGSSLNGKTTSLPNLERAIKGLKTLAAWCGWYAMD